MEIKYLQEAAVYDLCIQRIEQINAETTPQWGKMDAAQMFEHCAEVQEVLNGSKALSRTPFVIRLLGPIIKKAVLSTKPYPKSSQTHPQYIIRSEQDFQTAKHRLIASLDAFRQMSPAEALAVKHPIFGKMDQKDKGWAGYKHLDHHLRQFGV
ncbi:MAG: DUF1569 domain-containing protein [Bacteroidota bacterium]